MEQGEFVTGGELAPGVLWTGHIDARMEQPDGRIRGKRLADHVTQGRVPFEQCMQGSADVGRVHFSARRSAAKPSQPWCKKNPDHRIAPNGVDQ